MSSSREAENRVAQNAIADMQQLRADLDAFGNALTAHEIEEPKRSSLLRWFEEHFGGRMLDHAERALRGIRREN